MLSLSTSASRSNSSSLAYEGGTKGALMMVLSYIQGTPDFSGATYIPTHYTNGQLTNLLRWHAIPS